MFKLILLIYFIKYMDIIKWSNGVKPIKSNKNDKKLYENDNNNIFNELNNNSHSKREQVNDKINQRELLQNTCKNPFFESQDYIKHIANQHDFLMPQKSN